MCFPVLFLVKFQINVDIKRFITIFYFFNILLTKRQCFTQTSVNISFVNWYFLFGTEKFDVLIDFERCGGHL